MAKKTQKQRILNDFQLGYKITPKDALSNFGCFRLAAVVCDLRKEGHDIETTIIPKKGYAKYIYNVS